MTLPADQGSRDTPRLRVVYRGSADRTVVNCHPRDLSALLKEGGHLWVDIDSTVRADHALLEKVFRFHHLAIDDTLNPQSRVKLEEYDGYLFIIVRGIAMRTETEDPYDLETKDLYAFLGANYVVTVHSGPLPSVDRVYEMLQRSPELLDRGAERTLHAIFDDLIDAYFPILDQLDEFVDRFEEQVFTNFDASALRDVFQVRRLVLSLRKYLQPTREVMNVLSNRPSTLIKPEVQLHFRDIYDHVLRINESLDIYRELLSSTMESYLTQVSNRLGSTTKALSVVATLSIPFVVVSGMWGMNFAEIPLSEWRYGFLVLLVAQLLLGLGLLAYLRFRRWI